MKFSEVNVTNQKEVLKRKLGGELFAPITLAPESFTMVYVLLVLLLMKMESL